jgi:radical SAM-linked protein
MREDGEYYAPPAKEAVAASNEPVQRIRLGFTKTQMLRFVSHLDLVKIVQLIFRRAQLNVAYSQGFNPSPKMTFAPPLPMGFASTGELVDVVFTERYETGQLLDLLRSIPLSGLEWTSAVEVPVRTLALVPSLETATYELRINTSTLAATADDMNERLRDFSEAPDWNVAFSGRNKIVQRNLKESILAANSRREGENGLILNVTVNMRDQFYVNPVTAIEHITECGPLQDWCSSTRTGLTVMEIVNAEEPVDAKLA